MDYEKELRDIEIRMVDAYCDYIYSCNAKLARPIPEEAEAARLEFLPRINSLDPKNPIESKAFCSRDIHGQGTLVKLEDGKLHALLRHDIAHFHPNGYRYQEFLDNEPIATPKDYFRYIYAHECGHVKCYEQIRPKVMAFLPPGFISPSILREFDESFAFWFGDLTTGFQTPLVILTDYDKSLPEFRPYNVIRAYHELSRISKEHGTEAAFDPERLGFLIRCFF